MRMIEKMAVAVTLVSTNPSHLIHVAKNCRKNSHPWKLVASKCNFWRRGIFGKCSGHLHYVLGILEQQMTFSFRVREICKVTMKLHRQLPDGQFGKWMFPSYSVYMRFNYSRSTCCAEEHVSLPISM